MDYLGGILILASSITFLSFTKTMWFMIFLFVLGGIGIGVGLPCLDAFVTSGIEKEQRGTVSSVYSSMRFVGVAAGPPVMAVMMKSAEHLIFYILAGLSLLAALVTLKAIKPEKSDS